MGKFKDANRRKEMIKIFISHKFEDREIAVMIQKTLKNEGVEVYLDTLDDEVSENGEKLTKHIRQKLTECTDVIVLLSSRTKESWWVPFEIGMATEKDMPIANYLVSAEKLPEYLEFWPRLKNQHDVKKYVEVKREVRFAVRREKMLNEGYYQRVDNGISETQRFYEELKKKL